MAKTRNQNCLGKAECDRVLRGKRKKGAQSSNLVVVFSRVKKEVLDGGRIVSRGSAAVQSHPRVTLRALAGCPAFVSLGRTCDLGPVAGLASWNCQESALGDSPWNWVLIMTQIWVRWEPYTGSWKRDTDQ